MNKLPRWAIHNDLSGKELIEGLDDILGPGLHYENVPRRVYITTPWGQLIIGESTQAWFPWKVKNRWVEGGRSHMSDRVWLPIVWHPRSKERWAELDAGLDG